MIQFLVAAPCSGSGKTTLTCALLAALTLVVGVLYSYFGRVQESQLRDELSLAAVGVTQSGKDYLRQLESDQYRITWVAADGSVLYDTQADASAMENHAQRQEVRQALPLFSLPSVS